MIAIDNTLLKEALHIFAAEENKAIEKMLESAPKPQESLYNYCNETAQKIANEQTHPLPFKKAIALLIAAVLIVSMLGVAAYALRDQIGGFFVDFFEKYILFTTDEADPPSYSPSDVSIEYIPEGFNETRRKMTLSTGSIDWEHDSDIISLFYGLASNMSLATDNENTNLTIMEIGDMTVFLTEKYGQTTVRWTDETLVYILSTTGLEWDEIEKIVKGISFSPKA